MPIELHPSAPLSYCTLQSQCFSIYWHEYKINFIIVLGGCVRSGGGNVKQTEIDRKFTN